MKKEDVCSNDIEISEVIGKGSFGVVYKGKWKCKVVAIKEFHFGSVSSKLFTLFSNEVSLLSRISHPNIIQFVGSCVKSKGLSWIIMEYADGGTLHNVLHECSQCHYDAGQATRWTLQIAQGVTYLHTMKPEPLIHRDLKPMNLLMVNEGHTIKITDFGCACAAPGDLSMAGSAAWRAPEIFQGFQYTEKCDVFSWSIILWEILTRQQPFAHLSTGYSVLWAISSGERPPLIYDCPPPLEQLMHLDIVLKLPPITCKTQLCSDDGFRSTNLPSEPVVLPLEPLINNEQSVKIYQEHLKVLEKYNQQISQISAWTQMQNVLAKRLAHSSTKN